ncbi:MAG: trehalose 6-phosphate phosphatase, partial [Chloroflexota bacterium]|nr:trehalose 6-phosphate phosphatase [Chloroflexota bacterium]
MSSHDAPRIPSSRSALESAPPPSAQSFVLAVAACRNALAHRPAGLITDVDGTISAIVSRPEDAAVLPGAAAALQVLVGRLDYLGVLSGRSPDVARVMVAVDGIDYIGLHGMAHWTPEGVLLHPEV